ncbi:UDP-N-acetylmuramoyl-L-alanyl-D-glutamate--L-lysine ligase [Atopococcus tabaci]|uniref:UDP-N-acetylmuramoyl-L-alanyl-D-glutamate--L- lysine ligase n=1 Tax=Atopococcus tabaci TaxID=269774 RepID=UPI000429AA8A|nr:UDP-N-acetylmuramoyl-L-alanyl-D-glutamate--L-lysine ligase [Atopococcus tabaci]
MYSLSFAEVQQLLKKEGLFREIVQGGNWHYTLSDSESVPSDFTHITYDSKDVQPDTLFFCKGATFKEAYLLEAVRQGAACYVSETIYEEADVPGIIVSDIRKSMALIAREFYGHPQEKLRMVGITGTKGKTTTTYFVKSILDHAYPKQNAIISTINTSLDGKTSIKSKLTTPESLDLYRMLAEAAANGMRNLVMEVSSQAYKLDRVYGLRFDVGVFLNISPDHIGPSEHPTLEDYLFCKRQLLAHSDKVVLFNETKHFPLLHEQAADQSSEVIVYGKDHPGTDYFIEAVAKDAVTLTVNSHTGDALNISGDYSIKLLGDFNKDNALAALIIGALLGASQEDAREGLKEAVVPGRMETFIQPNGSPVYVDYAHNYISLKKLLEYVKSETPDGKLFVVLGAPGGKGLSRRKDFGKVLSSIGDVVVLTSDDPDLENPADIAKEIASYIEGTIDVTFIEDRKEAIHHALSSAGPKDAVVLAGKGDDRYQITKGKRIPYQGDNAIVKAFIQQTEK